MSILQPPAHLQDAADAILAEANSLGNTADAISGLTGIASDLLPTDMLSSVDSLLGAAGGLDVGALASTLSDFTEFPTDILEGLLSDTGFLSSIDFSDLGSIADTLTSSLGDFSTFIEGFVDDIFEDVGGQVAYLEDIVNSAAGGAKDVIQGLATQPIPEAEKEEIIAAIKNGDEATAASVLSKYSDQSPAVLEQLLGQLDVTIAGTIVVNSTVGIFAERYEIGSNLFEWDAGDPKFTFISSEEELHAEIRNITREVTEVIVHSTDTYTNANLIAEQIDETQRLLGHDGIGYHYIIRRDGSLQRGRPVDLEGDHASVNNHNERSIALAFVGGINVPTTDSLVEEFSSAASLTRAQYNTFNKFLKVLYLNYPGMQVLGHNDIDENESDPGFDVIEYCFTKFNKICLFVDPRRQEPFTTDQINNFVTSTGVVRNDWVPY